ncbi:histidine phosphotransferase [Rhodovulum sp. BSW8]|uniref:Histidine phosphotransferase ChpT n=1 Tax=Rhodovulum visakhapatnamense TaxID=364297 RepID=A0A4R8FTM9_9RHOB|nr:MULTISPECIES: histidine phosphotransferase family protein [Rhodovulum]RBO54395.1 histidine phosphotransferase [Rhodovulum sp. BSW8]TDX30046.1 histidine phosphotransferase ChpT [Rhodovulum visakhapatnamense]
MTDLTALVGSRICHDLISPLGAIGNGMELLAMAAAETPDDAPGEELALISDSVARANARIRMFRLAFGAAGDGAEVAGREVCEILADYYGGSRHNVTAEPPAALSRAMAKVALLAVLCAETALPRGGRIALSWSEGRVVMQAEAERMSLDPRLWTPLTEGALCHEDLRPAEVQFALLPIALAEAGRRLTFDHDETHLTLAF